MKLRLLSLFVAAALTAGAAQAAEPAKAPAAPTAEQQAARAEIDRLVERIQELSKKLGEGNDVRVIVRRMDGKGPMMWHEGEPGEVMIGPGMDHDVMIERMGGPEGKGPHRIRIERMGPDGMMKEGMGPDIMMKHRMGPGPGLGIVMSPNTAAAGVKVVAVTPDSPAQKADLRAGDVILSVDGKSVGGGGSAAVDKARELFGDLKKDQVVNLRIARQGKTLDKKVKVDEIRRVVMINRGEGPHGMRGEMHPRTMMLPPGVEMEIQRIGPKGECKKGDEDCGLPMMFQAFRWQGLNLASLDAGLGRYFGTDKGVLVLNAGPDLKGLQSGDVIQRVGGQAVETPRDVMRALREKDEGAQLALDVLRERKPAAVTLTVPKSRPLPFMEPPAPPAPPHAPPPPPAPPSPPAD